MGAWRRLVLYEPDSVFGVSPRDVDPETRTQKGPDHNPFMEPTILVDSCSYEPWLVILATSKEFGKKTY